MLACFVRSPCRERLGEPRFASLLESGGRDFAMLLAGLTAQHPMTERSFELQVATQG